VSTVIRLSLGNTGSPYDSVPLYQFSHITEKYDTGFSSDAFKSTLMLVYPSIRWHIGSLLSTFCLGIITSL